MWGYVMPFVHLHMHSNFSFKNSTLKIEDIINATKTYDMPAVALTDRNNLCGAVRFYYSARNTGIKPLIGAELDTQDGLIVFIAMNGEGYSELCKLITILHLQRQGFCLFEDIAQQKNLIALSYSGEKEHIDKYKEVFQDRFYIALRNHKGPGDNKKVQCLANLAMLKNIKYAATNDVYYLQASHYRMRDMLRAMGENFVLDFWKRETMVNTEQYFKSSKAMAKLFQHLPAAISNTLEIAERCNITLNDQFRFPVFVDLPQGHNAKSYLHQLCLEGIKRLYADPLAATERLNYELSIIDKMGFNDYFLAMWDIVHFAKKRNIRCAGRGSAADAIVSYLLGITHVDPIRYNLLFERFLNPERKGMPDIDVDFDSNRRDEVINYVYEKYGTDKVAMVCTVNTMGARSAVREVAKTLGYNREEQSAISKRLPHIAADKIDTALVSLPELRGEFQDNPEVDKIFNYAKHFADFPRHLGTHNGGVVIADDLISKYTPLQNAAKGIIICQHDKDDVEKLGLVKMDLLGLKMLSNITDTLEYLNKQGIALDIDRIPLDDETVFSLLRTTKTVGLFQVESPGQRELLGRLQPTQFDDIIAQISLFRPGPMQGAMIQPFIDRRHNRTPIDYMHPKLEPALRDTYGVLVYQEQVLQIANFLAGFTLGQADLLRRAMTKNRTKEEMEAIREQFITGCAENEVDIETASHVFDKIKGFAAYGFNKAHAASFGWIAYQSAYLKTYYPKEFFCATLNNYPCGFYAQQVIVWEAMRLGIPVYSPNINCSEWDFTLERNGIRVGLKQVSGITQDRLMSIFTERLKYPFGSSQEFTYRTGLSQEVVNTLIKVGAFEKEKCSARKQQILNELQLMGISISGHPLEAFPVKYMPSIEAEKLKHKTVVEVAGIIVARQTPPVRSGKRIIFLTIQDPTGLVDVTVFPDTQEEYAKAVYRSNMIRVKGTIRKTGVWYSVIAKEIFTIA
jgi:error-prone DNA polymerase